MLFIPGNGGSYKQVRSLAAESDRAFNGGPLDRSFYTQAVLTNEEAGYEQDGFDRINGDGNDQQRQTVTRVDGQYFNHLDWFAVDLDGEHSAMDGRILEEHTEYVVQAIHRILDRYKESLEARSKDSTDLGDTLPKSVILVGHSMGGFVARAAVVHSGLRSGSVQTVLTLSSPHLSPPVATQPSLGYYFSRVNRAWRIGYNPSRSRHRQRKSNSMPNLSQVVVVSIMGGPRDYQVRSKMASLDGIIPSTHGLTIGAPGMVNVWLGMEHQSILWCNQVVVQVSHTLLLAIDRRSGQPFSSPSKRLEIFVSNLRSALPQTFNWMSAKSPIHGLDHLSSKPADLVTGAIEEDVGPYSCPKSVKWSDESHEKDLYIETYTVTVLAMDGRRRWLDIKKLGSDGRDHFVLVTNLLPCVGLRVHLWPEKNTQGRKLGSSVNQRLLEVTTKMVQLPAGPAPRQIEPGGQTEQAPPSGILRLSPQDLNGFRFITITVAPRLTISGRPPPAASMAVGQFYKPRDGAISLSSSWLLSTLFGPRDLQLVENHPLLVNLSLSVSMGVMPLNMELRTSSCGIRNSYLAHQESDDREHTSLCKLRCFPPLALIWDPLTGLAVIPNFYSETVAVDSSPALWGSYSGSKETAVVLLVDPHCGYKISVGASLSTAATRFLLIHGLQVAGFAIAILLFVLMQQARSWELDQPVPSVLASMEHNLSFPFPFLVLSTAPLAIFSVFELLGSEATSSFLSFVLVSMACYCFATGCVALLAMGTQVVFYAAATIQVFLKLRCRLWMQRLNLRFPLWLLGCLKTLSTLQVVRSFRSRPTLTITMIAVMLIFFVHPALGLIVLLLADTWGCYSALCSCLTACSRSQQQQKISMPNHGQAVDSQIAPMSVDGPYLGSPKTVISFGDTQLEVFNYGQGLLLLHLIATAMLIPSLVAWGQRLGMDRTLPWLLDASLSFCIILHGFMGSKLDANVPLVPLQHFWGPSLSDSGLSSVYAFGGLYSYLAGLALAPYRAFHALAVIGLLTAVFKILEKNGRAKGDYSSKRRHFHRH